MLRLYVTNTKLIMKFKTAIPSFHFLFSLCAVWGRELTVIIEFNTLFRYTHHLISMFTSSACLHMHLNYHILHVYISPQLTSEASIPPHSHPPVFRGSFNRNIPKGGGRGQKYVEDILGECAYSGSVEIPRGGGGTKFPRGGLFSFHTHLPTTHRRIYPPEN